MKKIAVVSGLVFLLGIGGYAMLRPRAVPVAPKPQPPVVTKPVVTKKPASTPRSSPISDELQRRLDESEKRADESSAEVAKMLTPELQKRLVDSFMRTHEPAYRSLFETWSLDPATSSEVLNIIRERETQSIATTRKEYQEGMANFKENKAVSDYDKMQSDEKLRSVLGEARVQELTQIDTRRAAEGMAKVRQMMKERGINLPPLPLPPGSASGP